MMSMCKFGYLPPRGVLTDVSGTVRASTGVLFEGVYPTSATPPTSHTKLEFSCKMDSSNIISPRRPTWAAPVLGNQGNPLTPSAAAQTDEATTAETDPTPRPALEVTAYPVRESATEGQDTQEATSLQIVEMRLKYRKTSAGTRCEAVACEVGSPGDPGGREVGLTPIPLRADRVIQEGLDRMYAAQRDQLLAKAQSEIKALHIIGDDVLRCTPEMFRSESWSPVGAFDAWTKGKVRGFICEPDCPLTLEARSAFMVHWDATERMMDMTPTGVEPLGAGGPKIPSSPTDRAILSPAVDLEYMSFAATVIDRMVVRYANYPMSRDVFEDLYDRACLIVARNVWNHMWDQKFGEDYPQYESTPAGEMGTYKATWCEEMTPQKWPSGWAAEKMGDHQLGIRWTALTLLANGCLAQWNSLTGGEVVCPAYNPIGCHACFETLTGKIMLDMGVTRKQQWMFMALQPPCKGRFTNPLCSAKASQIILEAATMDKIDSAIDAEHRQNMRVWTPDRPPSMRSWFSAAVRQSEDVEHMGVEDLGPEQRMNTLLPTQQYSEPEDEYHVDDCARRIDTPEDPEYIGLDVKWFNVVVDVVGRDRKVSMRVLNLWDLRTFYTQVVLFLDSMKIRVNKINGARVTLPVNFTSNRARKMSTMQAASLQVRGLTLLSRDGSGQPICVAQAMQRITGKVSADGKAGLRLRGRNSGHQASWSWWWRR